MIRTKKQAEKIFLKYMLKLQRANKIVRNYLIKIWERIRFKRGEPRFCGCVCLEMYDLKYSLKGLGR